MLFSTLKQLCTAKLYLKSCAEPLRMNLKIILFYDNFISD